MPINRSNEEQEACCLDWKQSGLSKVEYCKQNKISKSALYAWLNKFRDNKEHKINDKNVNQSRAIKFLRVNDIKRDKEYKEKDNVLEILMPNGARVKVNAAVSDIKIFLRELLLWK